MSRVESQAGLQVVSFEDDPDIIESVDWWITSLCNLACDFCYGPEPGRDPAHLREQIALVLAASPAKTITFCGGEPLILGKEVFEYARLFKAAGKRVVLNTNGELLESAIERFLLPGEELPFEVVGVSIEGHTQDTHGEMRQGRNNKPASLAATYAGVLAVKEYETTLKVASVVSGVSVKWLPQLVQFVRHEVDPDVMRLYHYNPNGPVNHGQDRHYLSLDDFETAVRTAEQYAWRMPTFASNNESQACLIVDPNGGISVSTKTGYKLLGDCLAEPIGEIWTRQPDSLRANVRRNKRWIGASTTLGAAARCLESAADTPTDFLIEPRDLPPKNPAVELRALRGMLAQNSHGYHALKNACLASVADVMTPNEAWRHWYSACGEVMLYSGADGRFSDRDLVAANKIADRFLYYADRADLLYGQQIDASDFSCHSA